MKFSKICRFFIYIYSAIFFTVAAYAESDNFVLVIDPGHGGKDTGAVDNNVREKDINLSVAKLLAEMLHKDKNIKVVMTRDNDTYLTLQERADVANASKGNLFISIHTNSVDKSNPNRTRVSGANVYALGLHKDQNNLKVAQRENAVIELEKNFEQKYSGFDPSKDESYIIFEMAQKNNLGQSLKFANEAQQQLVKVGGRTDRGVKQAGFWVLWATSMPAVLVELDFICNPNSAKFMASEQGARKLAESLYIAVKNYVKNYKGISDPQFKQGDIPVDEPQESEPVAQADAAQITNLVTAPTKTARSAVAPRQENKGPVARKRRSETGRKISEQRDLVTQNITLHTETERMGVVKVDDPAQKSVEQPVVAQTKGKKDKKVKEKKDNKPKVHQSTSGYHAKSGRLTTIYKVQILASADKLKPNNPRFAGLKPISVFKDKTLYKYTYGETTDKGEIERILKSVRQKFPDAFIISVKTDKPAQS